MYPRPEGRCFRRVASSLKPVVSIYVRIDQDGSSCGGHDLGRDAPQPGPNQSGQAPAADGYERGLHRLGGFEEHVGRVAAGDPGLRPATEYLLQITGPLFEHPFVALAHLREVLDRGPRLSGRNLGQIGMRVDEQTPGTESLPIPAASSPALRASSEKSSPMTILAGGQKSSAPVSTSTGTWAWCTISSDWLPIRMRRTVPSPRLPTTRRSASISLLRAMTSLEVRPLLR